MGAKFDHSAVIVGGSVGENGLRLGDAENSFEVGMVEIGIEMEFGGVATEESAVGFGDGDDLDFRAVEGMGEEAVGVAVNQARDDDAERGLGVGGRRWGDEEQSDCDWCGEAKQICWHAGISENQDDSTGSEKCGQSLGLAAAKKSRHDKSGSWAAALQSHKNNDPPEKLSFY